MKSLQFFHFTETSHELHVDTRFASIVHEEVVDLVDGVLLLEHDEVLAATQSFHLFLHTSFGHNLPGIRVFEFLLDSQRESALFLVPKES